MPFKFTLPKEKEKKRGETAGEKTKKERKKAKATSDRAASKLIPITYPKTFSFFKEK